MKRGHVDTGLHYNIDLLPTLAALLDREPRRSWDGESFAAALREGTPDRTRLSGGFAVLSRLPAFGTPRGVALHAHLPRLLPPVPEGDALSHFGGSARTARSGRGASDVCSELARCYLDWHDEMMATQPEGFFHDPMWEELHRGGPCHAHGHLAGYCGRLERTGRGWAVPLLKERHPEEFR